MESGLAIVTGADGGMGRFITCALAQNGYSVIMACFDTDHGEKVCDEIKEKNPDATIEVRHLNLASLSSVEKFTDQLLREERPVARLINNAGKLSTDIRQTQDGIEPLVSINYIGPYLLTRRLLPLFYRGSRIVNTISCTYAIGRLDRCFLEKGRQGVFRRIPVYSNTKLALFLFTRELAERVAHLGVSVNAADPGIVSTKMIKMNAWFDCLTDLFYRPFIKSAAQGASTAIFLSLSHKVGDVTGWCFRNCSKASISRRLLQHPQQKQLWIDTERFIIGKGFNI